MACKKIRAGGAVRLSPVSRKLAGFLASCAAALFFLAISATEAAAGTATIERSGAAVTFYRNGADDFDLENSAYPGGIVFANWFGGAKPTYRFFIPPPVTGSAKLVRFRLEIRGQGGWAGTFDEVRVGAAGNFFIASNPSSSDEGTYVLMNRTDANMDDFVAVADSGSIGYYVDVEMDLTSWSAHYDLDWIRLTYEYSGVSDEVLDGWQTAYSAYRMFSVFDEKIVDGAWGNLGGEQFFEGCRWAISFAQNLNGLDGNVVDVVRSSGDLIESLSTLYVLLSNMFDPIEFLLANPGFPYDTGQCLSDAANDLAALAQTWRNVGFDGITEAEKTTIYNALIAAKAETEDLKAELNSGFYAAHDVYQSRGSGDRGDGYGDITAEKVMRSYTPLMRYARTVYKDDIWTYSTTEDPPLLESDSYVPQLINELSATAAQYATSHIVIAPSTPMGPALFPYGDTVTFATGGAACSEDHAVEYRFDWGDGSYSLWGSASRGNQYDWSDVYTVKAQARCTSNTSIVSAWSGGLVVRAYGCELTPTCWEGTDASSDTVGLHSMGSTVSYTISDNATWLSVSPSSGTSTGPDDPQWHTVSYSTSGLSLGAYQAIITVHGFSNELSWLVTLTVTPAPPAVDFPDASLEAVVRDTLGIAAPTPITPADMQGLTELEAEMRGISNIQGLQHATNLTRLWLGEGQISDLTPLAGLDSLVLLELRWHQVSDLTPLAGLTNLTWLYLDDNQISDISPLAGLTNLDELWLDHNQISDISAVAGLTNLPGLHLSDNQISDISAVAGLGNLTRLHLSVNQISDISAVAGLTNLTRLYLSDNQISDISAVAGLTNLNSLRLSSNQIEIMNLSSADLSSLRYFSIEDNPLTDVLLADATLSQTVFNVLMGGGGLGAGIAELPGVLTLDMSGVDFAGIPDLSAMYGMDDLEELFLSGATNLDGAQVLSLTNELDSLAWLDVTSLWDSFDAATQVALNSWGALEGNTLVGPAMAPIVSWHMVATHGGVNVVLVLDEGYIDSRTVPSLVLRLNFDVPLDPTTIVPGAVSLHGQVGGDLSGLLSSLTLENGGTTLAVSLATGLPNADRYAFTLSDTVRTADGREIGGQKSLTIGALQGDVNKDGVVSNADILATRAWAAQLVAEASAQYDVNCSGIITGADMLTVRQHLGTELP